MAAGIIKLPVSAIVVGKNDGSTLERCLAPLSFCDELIYVDLESSDNSVKIAEQTGAVTQEHKSVPIVEIVHASVYQSCKHPIILITDPDEVLDPALIEQIPHMINLLTDENLNYGAVYVPMRNYFAEHPLSGTVWGGSKLGRICLVNRNRFEFKPFVHSGRVPLPGYTIHYLPFTGQNVVHHYWAVSKTQLKQKHNRYLNKEGEAMYSRGLRTNAIRVFFAPIAAFFDCLITKKGFKDGSTGWWLSSFWAWYRMKSEQSLYYFQKRYKGLNAKS